MTIKFSSLLILYSCLIMLSCSSSNVQTKKPNASLTNTRWVLRVLNDQKIITPEGGKEVYISLTNEGNKANGSGGCNNFFTTYTITGKALKFGNIASTRMLCENVMNVETTFFKALESTQRYEIKGDNLYLYDSSKEIAKLEAVYL